MRPLQSPRIPHSQSFASTESTLRSLEERQLLCTLTWVTYLLWLISLLAFLYHGMMNRKDRVNARLGTGQDFMQTVEVVAGFRRGLRQFLSFSESMVGAVEITSQQYRPYSSSSAHAMKASRSVPSLEKCCSCRTGAVQLVNRLSEAGLAERRADERDARVSRVHATPRQKVFNC